MSFFCSHQQATLIHLSCLLAPWFSLKLPYFLLCISFSTSPIVRGLDLQYAKYSLLLSFLSLYDPIPKTNALFHLTDAFLPFLVDNYRAGIANPNACRSQKDILSGDDEAEIMENWSDALLTGATVTELRLTLTMENWDPNIARSFDFSEDLEIQVLCWNFPTVKCCQLTQQRQQQQTFCRIDDAELRK